MNFNAPYNPNTERLDIRKICGDARECMRVSGNYGRTVKLLGLYMLLVNVPLMIMQLVFYDFGDFSALTDDALQLVNTRLMLFQALIALFVTPAFELSKSHFMLETVGTGTAGNPSALFDGLNGRTYFLAVRAMLWKLFMMYAWMMLPSSIMVNGIYAVQMGGGRGMLIISIAIMAIVMISRVIAYAQQFNLLAQQPQMGAILSQRMSTAMMHGRWWEFIRLNLRLLPYTILPFAVNILPYFVLTDSLWFASAMELAAIVLYSALRPIPEAAYAEYYLAIRKSIEAHSKHPVEADFSVDDESDGAAQSDDDYAADTEKAYVSRYLSGDVDNGRTDIVDYDIGDSATDDNDSEQSDIRKDD